MSAMSAAWPRNLQFAPELVTQTYPIGPMTIWSKLLTIEELRRAHSAESQAKLRRAAAVTERIRDRKPYDFAPRWRTTTLPPKVRRKAFTGDYVSLNVANMSGKVLKNGGPA